MEATVGLRMAPGTVIDLADEGLSPGDTIDSYLSSHWRGGNEVHIPAGSYTLNDPGDLGISTSSDAWLIGDGEVVLNHGGGRVNFNVISGGGHIRLENLTLKGVVDGGRIAPYADDSDGLIEFVNFNRPDGCKDGTDAGGFYVPGVHAGVLRYINCEINSFSNNGIYASSPGKDANGPVEVYGGLYKNNDVAGVRLGSAGSKCIGVVIVNDRTGPGISGGNAQRGIRIREPGPVEVRDCDITHLDKSGVSGPIMVENHIFNSDRPGGLRVENTRIRNDIGTEAVHLGSGGYDATGDDIHLSGSGNLGLDGGPYSNVVKGSGADAPVTEKRWVDPDSLEPEPAPEPEPLPEGSVVEVIANGDGAVDYEFTADAVVHAHETSSTVSSVGESNVVITDQGDGTYHVAGRTGGTYGDAFLVESPGVLLSFTQVGGDGTFTLRVDGEVTDPATIGGGDSGSGDGSDGTGGEELTEAEVVALIEQYALADEDVRQIVVDEIRNRFSA